MIEDQNNCVYRWEEYFLRERNRAKWDLARAVNRLLLNNGVLKNSKKS
jgi:hypothetical protein